MSRAVDIDRQRSVLFGHRLRALAALSHYGAGALPAEVDPGRPRFHPDGPTGDVWLSGLEIAAAEYAAASTVSPREAQATIAEACRATFLFSESMSRLGCGMTEAKLSALVGHTWHTSDQIAAEVERRVLPEVAGDTPTAFARRVIRSLIELDPLSAVRRRRRADHARRITVGMDGEGVGYLHGVGPMAALAAVKTGLNDMAKRARADGQVGDRSLANLEFDILISLLLGPCRFLRGEDLPDIAAPDGAAPDGAAPDSAAPDSSSHSSVVRAAQRDDPATADWGHRVALEQAADDADDEATRVRRYGFGTRADPREDAAPIDIGALSGIDPSDVEDVAEVLRRFPGLWPFVDYTHYRRPQILAKIVVPATVLAGADDWACELARFGPIDPDLARELASDARWQLILSDPGTGQVVDVGKSYRPPAAMRRRIKARDHHCRWPGCDAPADRCEIDHALAFPQGSTSDDNCLCLCKFHHRVKHQTGVRITMVNGGPTVITTATGRAYRTSPPRAGPTKPVTRLTLPAQPMPRLI